MDTKAGKKFSVGHVEHDELIGKGFSVIVGPKVSGFYSLAAGIASKSLAGWLLPNQP